LASVGSLVCGEPSPFSIEALEPCVGAFIGYEGLLSLAEEHREWARLVRRLLERLALKKEQREADFLPRLRQRGRERGRARHAAEQRDTACDCEAGSARKRFFGHRRSDTTSIAGRPVFSAAAPSEQGSMRGRGWAVPTT
jgi:CRP-like cAMP-binding protein